LLPFLEEFCGVLSVDLSFFLLCRYLAVGIWKACPAELPGGFFGSVWLM
jgi:hypothetical protein